MNAPITKSRKTTKSKTRSKTLFGFHLFLLEIKVEKLGCYNQGDPKALPEVLKDFEGTFKPKQASKVLNACAKLAKAKGYTHFGLGENQLTCFSGPDAANTYDDGGKAKKKKCTKSGQGKAGAVYVYKLAWGEKGANPV